MESGQFILKILYSTSFPAIGYYLIKGNMDFFKIIDDFHSKLPPKNKKAKPLNLKAVPFNTIDVTNAQFNLSDAEIDLFHKKLETFNYNRIIFKRKKIEIFSKNIQRHLSEGKTNKFKLSMVQAVLEDEPFVRLKTYLFGYRLGKLLGF